MNHDETVDAARRSLLMDDARETHHAIYAKPRKQPTARLCSCGCGDPIQTEHPNALYAHEACKTRAYRHRQHEAAQAGRVTAETPRKPIADMSQYERVERALTIRGPRGITQIDFDLPNVMDGGRPIKRVAARIDELRKNGRKIDSDGPRRKKCAVYVLEPTGQLFAPDDELAAAA